MPHRSIFAHTFFTGTIRPSFTRSEHEKKKSTVLKDIVHLPECKNPKMRIKSSQGAWSQYGGLGPDLDNEDVVNKRAAFLRAKHFSVQLREVNRERILSDSNTSKLDSLAPKAVSNRERAKEFAKTIEKPRQRMSSRPLFVEVKDQGDEDEEEDALSKLFRRHRELQKQLGEVKARYS
jgi:hypothetical protein